MKNNKKGFSLIEVLISVAILSIIGMAFYTTIASSIKHNKKNEVDITSLSISNTIVSEVESYIKHNNKFGISSNEGTFERSINNALVNDKIEFYVCKDISNNNSLMMIDERDTNNFNNIKSNPNAFKVSIILKSIQEDNQSIIPNAKLYEVEIKIIPNSFSKKEQSITTKIYSIK